MVVATGVVVDWRMNNGTIESSTQLLSDPSWTVVEVGDFFGNGTDDILWRQASTGTVVGSTRLLVNPAWTVTGVGDYNGDGKSDIVWTNAGTGQTAERLMNGASVTSSVGLLTNTACSARWSLMSRNTSFGFISMVRRSMKEVE